MRFTWVLLGSILCTTITLGLELVHDDKRLAWVLTLLIVVLVKEHLSVAWWYGPFFTGWLGATYLIANWLEVRWGRGSDPAFASFGPGFLIMAFYEVVRYRLTWKQSKANLRP
jgi:hypothetical protein